MTGSVPAAGGLTGEEAAHRLRDGGANAIADGSTHLVARGFDGAVSA